VIVSQCDRVDAGNFCPDFVVRLKTVTVVISGLLLNTATAKFSLKLRND